jgi:hypothetical protein
MEEKKKEMINAQWYNYQVSYKRQQVELFLSFPQVPSEVEG